MQNRIKIGQSVSQNNSYKPSDIYRQFTPAFRVIFSATSLALDELDGKAGYVKNEIVEEWLNSFSSSTSSSINHFVGETGIGKSTYIRNIYGSLNNPYVIDKHLVVPFYLNGKNITINNYKDRFVEQLRAACDICCESIQDIDLSNYEKLYNFIYSHNAALLSRGSIFDKNSKEVILRNLEQTDEYAFFAEILKYICCSSNISNVTLVFDDLESITDNQALSLFLNQAYRFHTCFGNTLNRSYAISTIIAIRPSTNSILDGFPWYAAYTPSLIYTINNPSSLSAIFLKRVEYITEKHYGTKYKDVSRVNEAISTLSTVMTKFEERTLGIISEVSNHNIRVAIRSLASIVGNRRYVQGNTAVKSYFVLSCDDYLINGGTIIKSMMYGESDIYRDDKISVFNILNNGKDLTSDLIIAYICKFFYHQNDGKWDNFAKIKESDIISSVEKLCGDYDIIASSIDYLLSRNVIEKFIIKSVNNNEEVNIYYMASPSLFGAFHLLEMNSVYFDAIRDDTFIDSENKIDLLQESLIFNNTFPPVSKIKEHDEKVKASTAFLAAIFKSEFNLLSSISLKDRPVIKRKFGDSLISSTILKGLMVTVSATSATHNEYLLKLTKLINKFESSYGGY